MLKTQDILLIEDNEDHAELIKRCFEENDIINELLHLSDGEQALDYLFQRSETNGKLKFKLPDLILLDLRLPKVDGLSVLKELKKDKYLKKIPVIILTSSDAEFDLNEAYANSVNSYLVKPFDFEKFRSLIKDIGYYWLKVNQSITPN